MGQVLVVDDDPELRSLLREAREAEGYEVFEATEGSAALDLLRRSPQRFVVLLDYLMPRVGGKQVIQLVSQDAGLSRRHAYILMTARSRLSLPVEVVNTLALSVVRKPFELDDLFGTVAEAQKRLEASS